jgi:hypothetical protein
MLVVSLKKESTKTYLQENEKNINMGNDLITIIKDSLTKTDGSQLIVNILTIVAITLGGIKSFISFFIVKPIVCVRNYFKDNILPSNSIIFDNSNLTTFFSNSFYQNKNVEFKLKNRPETTIIIKERKLLFFYIIKEQLTLNNEKLITDTNINEKNDQFIFNYTLSENLLLTIKNNLNNKIFIKTILKPTGYNKDKEIILFEDITKEIRKDRIIFQPLLYAKTLLLNQQIKQSEKDPNYNKYIENKLKEQNPWLIEREPNEE